VSLFAIKPHARIVRESQGSGNQLKRTLGPVNLVALGIGAIIGAGLFALTPKAAHDNAGPAVVFSFMIAALGCAFAGMCYSEFSTMIPIAGSAYTYAYATMGELLAWIIGWDLVLEYAFGAATVASGWSGYFNSLLQQYHIYIPPALTTTTGNVLVFYKEQWTPLMTLPHGVDPSVLPHVTGICNLIAVAIVMVITTILVVGIKESANFNSVIVVIKLGIVGVFLAIGGYFLFRHPEVAKANWHPFIPPSDGHGNFGWGGIPRGAARIFFAYIGFDAVSTAAQEAKKPQRDMPIGILGSLAVCTVLYILVSTVLTGLVPYSTLNVGAPVAVGIDATGVSWGATMVKIGAVFGLATVMLVMLLGQTRVFYSMSKDGLLWKWASAIHPKFRTPWITTIVFGIFAAIMPAFLPIDNLADLVNIGTLLAFTIVCAGVWILRVRHPNLHRPFKTPLVPLVPILGILSAGYLMTQLAFITWAVMIGWLLFGLIIYFGYSMKHSKVQQLARAAEAD
jgi:APA family basic amino acid/polyamine antiporter